MRNNFFITLLLYFLFFPTTLVAGNLEISSSEVKLNKKDSKIILKGNINSVDENNNILQADEAFYSKNDDLLNSVGLTSITTNGNYYFESSNVIFDNKGKMSL